MISKIIDDLKKINPRPSTLEECWEVIDKLIKINLELLEKLNNNSNNSSLPPSKDFRKRKPRYSKKSLKKQGGQHGRIGISRKLIPSSEVDNIVSCEAPSACPHCSVELSAIKKITRHQVYDIPRPKYEVTEYQIKHSRCKSCRVKFSGKVPVIGRKGFGIRTHAFIGLLTSKFKTSKRQAIELIKDVYNMPISVGSISNVEARVSSAIEPIHNQIKAALLNSKIINIDETGFKQNNKNGWAWVMANELYSYYKLDNSRGRKVAKELIGSPINRFFVTDRYPVYDYLPPNSRQVCWAHIKRDCQKISERSGISGIIGKELLSTYGKIYSFYRAIGKGKYYCPKRTRKRKKYLKNLFNRCLKRGIESDNKNTSRTCEKIYSQGVSLWLFLDNPQIPATNNLAERQLRPLVIAKKLSFGTKAIRGARYIERAYSLSLSCKQLGFQAMEWFENSINNFFLQSTSPTIRIK